MQTNTLLALAAPRTLSYFEPCFHNHNILHCRDLEFLKSSMQDAKSLLMLVELACCTSRHIEAFMGMATQAALPAAKLNFIFFFQTLDNSVYQRFSKERSLLLIGDLEKDNAPQLTARFLQGQAIYLRSSERQNMDAPVRVKSSDWATTSTPVSPQQGRLLDFSKQGAKIYLPQKNFQAKEYISLQYYSQNREEGEH